MHSHPDLLIAVIFAPNGAAEALAEAKRRGIAVLGMKSMGGSGEMVRHGAVGWPVRAIQKHQEV